MLFIFSYSISLPKKPLLGNISLLLRSLVNATSNGIPERTNHAKTIVADLDAPDIQ